MTLTRSTGIGGQVMAAPVHSSPTLSETRPKNNQVRMGAGQTHHFALSVPDEETQLGWRLKLSKAGYRVSPVMDRVYFKNIYTNYPDGHIVELTTVGPGFAVDEDITELGQNLKLPPWLESKRAEIEQSLRPVVAPIWSGLEEV